MKINKPTTALALCWCGFLTKPIKIMMKANSPFHELSAAIELNTFLIQKGIDPSSVVWEAFAKLENSFGSIFSNGIIKVFQVEKIITHKIEYDKKSGKRKNEHKSELCNSSSYRSFFIQTLNYEIISEQTYIKLWKHRFFNA